MNLRNRVLAGSLLIATLLGVAGYLVIEYSSDALLDQIDERLYAARGPLDDVVRPGYPEGPGPGAPGAPRLSDVSVVEITPLGTATMTVASDLPGAADVPIDISQCRSAAVDGAPFTVADSHGERFRLLAYEIPGQIVRVLSVPLRGVDTTLERVALVVGITALGVLAALALVAWWVIRLGIRPIKAMTATAAAIAGGDLTHRVPEAPSGTEAGELGRSLNTMLASIESAFDVRARSEQRLRRFAADASHELRTPVTTIRGYAELYRAGGLSDPAALDEAMLRTESESVRMGRLVDDLLLLARLDQGRNLERRPVDLRGIGVDAASDATVRDQAREISGPSGTEAVTVLADADRLRQVVANLVSNAMVHTPAGSPVAIEVDRSETHGRILVQDNGDGMSPEVAARAFERFYRADPSRSRSRGGSGLGLSIVVSIVDALGGTVELDNRPGVGLGVLVSLPLAPLVRDAREG